MVIFTKLITLLAFIVFFALSSCQKNDGNENPDNNIPDIEKLNIPADFDFSTTNTISLHITDGENGAKYDIYTLKSESPEEIIYTEEDTVVVMDDMNTKLASGMVNNGLLNLKIVTPAYHKYLYIIRSKDGNFNRESIEVTDNEINYSFGGFKSSGTGNYNSKVTEDVIYTVNGDNGEIYKINYVTGDVEYVGENPFTSNAAGIDPVNGRLYITNKNDPYELGYYDLNTGTFTVTGNIDFALPRMDYNISDGLLYISKKQSLYTIDPSNGQYLQSFSITGIQDASWGDLAFAQDGTLYILSTSGVYKCDINGNTVYATEISDNTLPKKLTSIVVGSDGMIYMAGKKIDNEMIKMDPATGSWNYIPVNGTIKVNDFAILRPLPPTGDDSDGDGVNDSQDDYPNDPERAFDNYFPGQGLWATLAFEDLWPSKGDYDFNDLVAGYNINQVTNAQNQVVDVIAKFDIRHNGAGLHNGFAFQIPVEQSNVSSVTTDYQPMGEIELNGNGTIKGQDLTNILVFEDNWTVVGNQINITINFSNPVPVVDAGTPPYNPYLLKDDDQSVEIHLPDMAPTQLADLSLFGTGDDTSDPATGRYYKTEKNLPWVINIDYDFDWMKEKVEIVDGYLHFAEWAESGGTVYQDWYKDLPGYRNESVIESHD